MATTNNDETLNPPGFEKEFEWVLDIAPLSECVQRLKSAELVQGATAFETNLKNIHSLLSLPGTTIGIGVRNFYWGLFYQHTFSEEDVEAISQLASLLRGEITPDGVSYKRMPQEKRWEKASQLLRQHFGREASTEEIASLILSTFKDLAERPKFRESIRILFLSTTTFLWTSFECLVTDCWVAALNSGSISFGHRALSALPVEETTDGISGKQIEVNLLARYGFDIRNHLGTILSQKFKFSSLEGIRVAYISAFQDERSIDSMLSNDILKYLESCRHLIVHRSGMVDERFSNKNPEFRQEVGKPLFINGKQVSEFGAAVVEAGVRLLNYLDGRLRIQRNKGIERDDD